MVFSNKRGQVTIFIIIALVLVAAILIYVFMRGNLGSVIPGYSSAENPLTYISECVEDSFREIIPPILAQGGYSDPQLHINFEGEKVAYLCYTSSLYVKCINQNPLYIQHLENEIEVAMSDRIESCFSTMKDDYERKGNQVEMDEMDNLDVSLEDRQVVMTMDRGVTIKRGDEIKTYNEFKSKINSPVYNLARVAQEIVAQESNFCYSEFRGYQLINPWVKIEKNDLRGQSKVYEITDKNTMTKLNIAVRSCAASAGSL